MLKSERFHKGGTTAGDRWVTETWEHVNAYTFNLGQQHDMFVGATWDYKLGTSFEAMIGSSVECSLAIKTAFCVGLNTEVKFAGDINFSKSFEVNCTDSDSVDICSGDNEMKGNTVLLQYEPTAVTKLAVSGTVAAVAGVVAGVSTAVAAGGMVGAACNEGDIKTSAHVSMGAAIAANLAAGVVNVAGLAAYLKNKVSTKTSTSAGPPAPAPLPYVKVEGSKITLHCGPASIVLDGATGGIDIRGTSVVLESTTSKSRIELEKAGDIGITSSLNLVVWSKINAEFYGEVKTDIGNGSTPVNVSTNTNVWGA
jgi:hypothetical protein